MAGVPGFCGPLGGFFARERPEPWKPAHDVAMGCRDLEEAVQTGLGLYVLIDAANRRVADAARAGVMEFDWETAEHFAAAYRWWLDGARPLIEAVKEYECNGFEVERAAEFRETFRAVSLLPLETESIRRNVEALESGKGITLGQALNEL
jgi:hypothetical protein